MNIDSHISCLIPKKVFAKEKSAMKSINQNIDPKMNENGIKKCRKNELSVATLLSANYGYLTDLINILPFINNPN